MAEIRSTLEIIMEKTKKMALTDEEKTVLSFKEIENFIKSLFFRYCENIINAKVVQAEIFKIDPNKRTYADSFLKTLILEHVNISGNNEPLFALLEDVLNISSTLYRNTVRSFSDRLSEEAEELTENLKKRLERNSVTGTAIIPNLDKNQEWIACSKKIHGELKRTLIEIKP